MIRNQLYQITMVTLIGCLLSGMFWLALQDAAVKLCTVFHGAPQCVREGSR